MIGAQQITGRMLATARVQTGATKAQLVNQYLRAFGAVGAPAAGQNGYPSVFKPAHNLEWDAYMREAHGGQMGGLTEESYLGVILDFLRYMKHMGINPFVTSISVPAAAKQSARFSLQGTYSALLAAALAETAAEILPIIRKTHLFTAMSPLGKAVVEIRKTNGVLTICSAFNLKPRRSRQTLDEVLSTLQGFMYRSATPPGALMPQWAPQPPKSRSKPKSKLLSVKALSASTSTIGWLVLTRRPNFQVCVRRSRDDTLVLNITLPISGPEVSHFGHRTKQVLKSAWLSAMADFK